MSDFPTVAELAKDLREASAEFDPRTLPPADRIDPETGHHVELDVRLQVIPGKGWTLWTGDSQYDTDHRGFWGSGSVPGRGHRFDSRELAADLIDQAKEWRFREQSTGAIDFDFDEDEDEDDPIGW